MDEPKITRELLRPNGEHDGWAIFCPGCKCVHIFDGRWKFNGIMDKPTFSPSMRVNKDDPASCCHSYIQKGQIRFLSDCFHSLKGQTVELEPF